MKKFSGLQFSVRIAVIASYLSKLLGLVAVFALVPMTVALLSFNYLIFIGYLAVILILTLIFFLGKLYPYAGNIQRNEGLLITALLFIITSMIMTIPMILNGISPLDAWFEAVSGVTTTGLTTLPSVEHRPLPFLFGRAWLQWIGGLSIVVLALSLLVKPGFASKNLGFSDEEMSDLVGGIRANAKKILQVYLILTALGIFLLLIFGSSIKDATIHAMTAISTGSFANYDDNIASLNIFQILSINLLCFMGAISFHVYYSSTFFTFDIKKPGNNQFLVLLISMSIGTIFIWLISFIIGENMSFLSSLTLSISAQSTAGFYIHSLNNINEGIFLYLIVIMFIGGSIGSTSGGIKLNRFLYLLSNLRLYLVESSVGERSVITLGSSEKDLARTREILTVVISYLIILVFSWFIFLLHGYDPLKSLFEVVSALSTVGLSSGITNQDLEPLLKIVLCINMLMGRLEIIAFLVIFYPPTWFYKRRGA